MIFVDSSVWIDYFNGQKTPATDYLDTVLGIKSLVVGDLVLTEVLQGFRHEKDYLKAKRLLSSLDIVSIGGEKLAIQSADYFRYLRKKGITVRKTIDVLIATYCLENDLPLLADDRDFMPFVEYLDLVLLPESIGS